MPLRGGCCGAAVDALALSALARDGQTLRCARGWWAAHRWGVCVCACVCVSRFGGRAW